MPSDPIRQIESSAAFIERKRAEVGRRFKSKDIGRKGINEWMIEAGTYMEESNLPEKVLVLERIRLLRRAENSLFAGGAQFGDVEYRLGYYIIARNGRWWWAQFSPFIVADDFRLLLEIACNEGTLLPEHLPFSSDTREMRVLTNDQ